MKLSPRSLAAVGIVAAALLLTSGGSSRARIPGKLTGRLDEATVRALAAPVANLIGQPGLPTMAAAVGYTESRYKTNLRNDSGMLGIFQEHPDSMRVDDLGLPSSVLFDPRYATALLAWYYKRLRPYARAGQTIDWLALRRGGAYPDLVDDVEETKQRSREVRERFEDALDAIGVPRSFMYQAAFPSGYHWPGINAVLGALGVSAPKAVDA